jgi:site-specific recombinase XerD
MSDKTTTKLAIIGINTDVMVTIRGEVERSPRLRSGHTKRGYLADLSAFEAWRANRPLTKLLVEAYATHLLETGRSPSTVNRTLAAVRWWVRRLADLTFEQPLPKRQREEIALQAERVAGVQDIRGERLPAGRNISEGEFRALLDICVADADRSAAGIRDAAIFALAWVTGMRRSELAGLQLADYASIREEEGELTIAGKGDKVRRVAVYNGAWQWLADWLELRGDAPGPLFLAINKGGRVQASGVSDEALAQMLEKRRVVAGLSPLSWHDFRRTFAGELLDLGTDLATVQKLMGHSSPVTTAAYDRRDENTRRKAVRGLHVPNMRRVPA